MASHEIEALSQALARLPGLGPRSARRAVLHLMKKREAALQPLLAALRDVSEKLSTCSICGNVDTSDPCNVCADPRRDAKSLCVVEEVALKACGRRISPSTASSKGLRRAASTRSCWP
jgi:recombination protein RecR